VGQALQVAERFDLHGTSFVNKSKAKTKIRIGRGSNLMKSQKGFFHRRGRGGRGETLV
jgi:hypothetical protein